MYKLLLHHISVLYYSSALYCFIEYFTYFICANKYYYIMKKLEENKNLAEMNERLKDCKVKERQWADKKEEKESERRNTAKVVQELKEKIKSAESGTKKKDKEYEKLKDEIS